MVISVESFARVLLCLCRVSCVRTCLKINVQALEKQRVCVALSDHFGIFISELRTEDALS